LVSQRAVKGVLGNFLGTYTSRYTDYEGYSLFGFIVSDLSSLAIDLLCPAFGTESGPLNAAVQLAASKFDEQMRKADLDRSQVREASLTIEKSPTLVAGLVNGHACNGYNVSFLARAITQSGKQYERRQAVFVAPHDARIEHRSGTYANGFQSMWPSGRIDPQEGRNQEV
jgi:hypothetical protein